VGYFTRTCLNRLELHTCRTAAAPCGFAREKIRVSFITPEPRPRHVLRGCVGIPFCCPCLFPNTYSGTSFGEVSPFGRSIKHQILRASVRRPDSNLALAVARVGRIGRGSYGESAVELRTVPERVCQPENGFPSGFCAKTAQGVVGSIMAYLGKIAFCTGRAIRFDEKTETCINDPEAKRLLRRTYRKPFEVPDRV
jgi:hypothetical protein